MEDKVLQSKSKLKIFSSISLFPRQNKFLYTKVKNQRKKKKELGVVLRDLLQHLQYRNGWAAFKDYLDFYLEIYLKTGCRLFSPPPPKIPLLFKQIKYLKKLPKLLKRNYVVRFSF